ncbi:hypothetical protein B0I35DRAFT_433756 [Stachybotrys elegans]|uniref:Uncharacterized protein n=1 Tax=Stachybotrys elegans TaxID=80388 RepID=A0A8K0SPQ0_9HYPO|nr:hypothetical protein B0I35DRAFT_433756 [Stachybotrys elegans]
MARLQAQLNQFRWPVPVCIVFATSMALLATPDTRWRDIYMHEYRVSWYIYVGMNCPLNSWFLIITKPSRVLQGHSVFYLHLLLPLFVHRCNTVNLPKPFFCIPC